MNHLLSRPSWPGHAAFMLAGAAFVVSDILWLRVLATTSCSLAILFNTFHPVGKVLWLPVRWNVFYVSVNAFYVASLAAERWVVLSDEEREIYEIYFHDAMELKDFQRLMRLARMEDARERTTVLQRGEPNSQLILLLDGEAELEIRAGVTTRSGGGMLGEVSFLHGGTASASVHLPVGCRYAVWDRETIGLARSDAAMRGLELAISRQLSHKLVATTAAMVDTTTSAQYGRSLAETLVCELTSPGGSDAPAEAYLERLRSLRAREGVSEATHARALAELGLPDESELRRQGVSVGAVASHVCAAQRARATSTNHVDVYQTDAQAEPMLGLMRRPSPPSTRGCEA